MSWTDGYVTDTNYTYGYYGEMSPQRVDFMLGVAGYEGLPPGPCCELGFGQGLSLAIHAASNPTRTWHGTDFSTRQMLHAQSLTDAAGVTAHLSDQSFAEYCRRTDLPDFAYIAIHGIWSWISDANRQHLVDFIARKLKPGGALYLSYNTPPGWGPMIPIQRLVSAHASTMGSKGMGSTHRMSQALDFVTHLLGDSSLFAKVNPTIDKRLTQLKTQDPVYLAHEYLNADWTPHFFDQVAAALEPAKLEFAASAEPLVHVPMLNFTAEQSQKLNAIPDLVLRELARDVLTGRQFRRDIWVKGSRKLTGSERFDAFNRTRWVTNVARDKVPGSVKCTLGEAKLDEKNYGAIFDLLDQAKGPVIQSQLSEKLSTMGASLNSLPQSMMVLLGSWSIAPAQSDELIEAARPYTDRLNKHLLSQSPIRPDYHVLASPVIGGGLAVPHVMQLLLNARMTGASTMDQCADRAAEWLVRLNKTMVRNGVGLTGLAENQAEMRAQAPVFFAQFDPPLSRLALMPRNQNVTSPNNPN
jgi:SAM-dependent methyltransferase